LIRTQEAASASHDHPGPVALTNQEACVALAIVADPELDEGPWNRWKLIQQIGDDPVFVPLGEDPDSVVADVRKRGTRSKTSYLRTSQHLRNNIKTFPSQPIRDKVKTSLQASALGQAAEPLKAIAHEPRIVLRPVERRDARDPNAGAPELPPAGALIGGRTAAFRDLGQSNRVRR
jgi:hypothetical protein